MPELPEVETTVRGIAPFLIGQKFVLIKVNQPSLDGLFRRIFAAALE